MSGMQRNTIAAIAVALFSLPVISVAHAKQGGKNTSVAYKAIYNTTSTISRPRADDSAYHGHFTLPEFSPDYHGSNGG